MPAPGEKVKLQFVVNGKKLAYDGLPENRERDFFDLVGKMKIPEDQVPAAYRENLPEKASTSDADIIKGLQTYLAAKAAKKAAKQAGGAGGETAGAAEGTSPSPTDKSSNATAPAKNPAPQPAPTTQQPPLAKQDSLVQEHSDGFTPEYRQDLNTFIESVVNSDRGDLRAKIRSAGQTSVSGGGAAGTSVTAVPPTTSQPPAPAKDAPVTQTSQAEYSQTGQSQRRESYVSEEEVMAANQAGAGAMKYMIYLYLDGSDATKVITVLPTVTFDDLKVLVERKFGHAVVLRFIDGDEKIDLDDDDTLQMFFYTQQGQKLKIFCSKTKAIQEDAMTMQQSGGGSHTAGGEKPGAGDGNRGASTGSTGKAEEDHANKAEFSSSASNTFTGHSGAVYCCCFAPTSDRFLSASRDKTVRLWNINDGTSQCMKGHHPEMVLSTDFSPDAEHIVSSSVDPTIKIWKASTCSKFLALKGHTDKVYCCRFNNTGKHIVSASCDRTVRVWSAVKGNSLVTLEGHTLMVFSCDFSQSDNGKLISSASEDRLVKIWDWERGADVRSLIAHTGPVWSCRFSPNDKYLVSASMDNEVKIWDLAMGKPVRTFTGHKSPVHDACFSRDGKYVFSCGRDYKILKWPVESPDGPNSTHVVEEFVGHTDIIYHIDVHKTKNQLLSCSLDQTVKLWNCKSE